jgi:prolyl 4-hydroxylase
MLKECMEACGVCGSGTDQDEANDSLQEECADSLDNCPQLAADTMFCSTEDGEHLLRDCRKSCGCCVTKTSDFGVEQEAAEGDADYAATKVITRESIKYMREIRNSIETANIRMCENKHALCSFWAALGECKTNTSFMNTDCAVACHSCYLIGESIFRLFSHSFVGKSCNTSTHVLTVRVLPF